jgi:hypothetical protein
MIEKIAVTDITRMWRNFICVAGVYNDGRSVRPLMEEGRFDQDWCQRNGNVIKPFSVIELDFLEPRPMPPHTEDHYINPHHVIWISQLDQNKKRQVLGMMEDGCVADIFGAELQSKENQKAKYIQTGSGNRSLGTIRPKSIQHFHYKQYQQCWDYRLAFTDHGGEDYQIKIVDLSFQSMIDYQRVVQGLSPRQVEQYAMDHIFGAGELYLRLGLARGWANYPECCYLQINGVYPIPDYMGDSSFLTLRQAINAERGEDISICDDDLSYDDIPF